MNPEYLNGRLHRIFPRVALDKPSWGGATYRAVLQALFSGALVDGAALDGLKNLLIERLGTAEAVLCGSGSLALELALRACDVRAGDEVIIPAFCCSAVVPPVLALRSVPVLADVGEELNLTAATVDAATTRKTKAVIVPHMFGNPADIAAIVELARAKRIRVIDDAAQALGATLEGRPAGSFGDAGVVSFGKEKICFGIGGGAFVTNHAEAVANHSQGLTRSRSARTVGVLAATLFNWRWRRWTRSVQTAFQRGAKSGPTRLPAPYRQEAMANLQAAVALSLVQAVNENIAARRERARLYRRLLGGLPRLELIEHRSGSACLAQLIRVLPKSRGEDAAAQLIAALNAAGYEVQGSYVPIHLLGCFDACVWDRLPRTERVWAELVELPCGPGVSLDHVERIAAMIRRELSES